MATRPPQRHITAGAFAALASLLLHVWVADRFPPLRLGRPADLDESFRFRSLALQDVAVTPPPEVKPVARYRPENPEEWREVYGAPEAEPAALEMDLPVPDAPEVPPGPLRADDGPAAQPEAREASRWEPRQEILEIADRAVEDHVAAMPRRFTEDIGRSDRAPDITFPADSAQILPVTVPMPGGGGALTLSIPRPIPRGRGIDALAGGGAGSPGSWKPDVASALAEKPEEISGLRPTEDLLNLAVSRFDAPDEDGAVYFQISISRRAEALLPVMPKDVLIMQDCSESMTAWKLMECKSGLRRWMDLLAGGDRFDVMGFSDLPLRCFSGWADATAVNRARALQFIDEMRARGNTDVYASLMSCLRADRAPGRPMVALLVTDGRPTAGFTDSSDIIEEFTRANGGEASMFSFGAGKKVNRFLLDLLSLRNRGDSRISDSTDEIPEAMEKWFREISRPVLANLSYRFTGLPDLTAFPATPTHLYLDRPLVIRGRLDGAPGRAAFQIVGRSAAEQRDLVFPLDLANAERAGPGLRLDWVWQRIYDLIGSYIHSRQPAILAEIHALAARHGLSVPYGKDIPGAAP